MHLEVIQCRKALTVYLRPYTELQHQQHLVAGNEIINVYLGKCLTLTNKISLKYKTILYD
jgi:hypothetical protein